MSDVKSQHFYIKFKTATRHSYSKLIYKFLVVLLECRVLGKFYRIIKFVCRINHQSVNKIIDGPPEQFVFIDAAENGMFKKSLAAKLETCRRRRNVF